MPLSSISGIAALSPERFRSTSISLVQDKLCKCQLPDANDEILARLAHRKQNVTGLSIVDSLKVNSNMHVLAQCSI